MSEAAVLARAQPDATRPDVPPEDQSVRETVGAVWHAFERLVQEQLQLLALEAEQAGRSLVWMIACGIIAGGLTLSAWFGVVGASVLVLVELGTSAPLALLLAALANALLALGFARVVTRRSRQLGFPATLRSLHPQAPRVTAAEPAP